MNRVAGRIGVFAASSHITAAVMLIGGLAWMAGPSCLVPRRSVELYDLCRAQDRAGAMALQREPWPINETFARDNLAGAIKAGLKLQGFDCGDPIPPQTRVGPHGIADIRAVLERLDAL